MSSVFVITVEDVLFGVAVIVLAVCFGITKAQDALRRRRAARRAR